MTDQLDDLITKIAMAIKSYHTTGKELARDPYQKGIRSARAYVTGQALLTPQDTRTFLELFDGNPEVALRVLRERLRPETAQLLPDGAEGLTLRFGVGPGESSKLALYTTPLYDTWHAQQRQVSP